MTIGSFEELTWRMDPSVSYSDWTIEITRSTYQEEHQNHNNSIDRYHVHCNVLAVGPRHSEYFAAQFQCATTKEHLTRTTQINLEDDARADAFPVLLDFLYQNQLPDLSPSTAAALHHLSEYFDMPQLRHRVEAFYRNHLTIPKLVEFIHHAKHHHAETLLQIAVETSVDHLLEMDVITARDLGPSMLYDILQTNRQRGNRRYGFHVSKLVAEACRHHPLDDDWDIFDQLTSVNILPYMEAKAAIYLLSIDAYHQQQIIQQQEQQRRRQDGEEHQPSQYQDHHLQDIVVLETNGVNDDMNDNINNNDESIASLQGRCVQAITEKWNHHLRDELALDRELNAAFHKIPPNVLITILMKTTEYSTIAATSTTSPAIVNILDQREKEAPDDTPPRILVQAAGNVEVNGLYARDGLFQGAEMYSRRGYFKGELRLFSMFQCLVGSQTKRWFISVIPNNGRPGTNQDIDFYSALVTEDCQKMPPASGWRKSSDGNDPPPELLF